MSVTEVIAALLILYLLEILYFKIADRYNIIDKPNHRSSHKGIIIRGGGIIFPIALIICPFYYGIACYWFLSGLLLISVISFLDDILTVSSRLRFLIHITAVALMFVQLDMFHLPYYWILLAFVLFIGSINAVNFMDGINGITGIYGLAVLGTLYYINQTAHFADVRLLTIAILSVIIFLFFNLRTKAKCFAGDVGSVSLAFILIFFILQLIITTHHLSYILLLLIYGLDAGTTIFFRILRKENIFEAHRSHFYQYMANEKKISHLIVAIAYGAIQLLINLILLRFNIDFWITIIAVFLSIIAFMIFRVLIEGRDRLLQGSFVRK